MPAVNQVLKQMWLKPKQYLNPLNTIFFAKVTSNRENVCAFFFIQIWYIKLNMITMMQLILNLMAPVSISTCFGTKWADIIICNLKIFDR